MADGSSEKDQPQNIATAVAEVSERATLLIREEIELAKAEVSEKAAKILKGTVVAAAAGIFVVTALFFVLIGFALLLYYELPGNPYTYFWGFFAMALILLVLGALAGFLAAKAVKAASPPVPTMAIDEARKIRETIGTPAVPTPAVPVPPISVPEPAPTPEKKEQVDASALGRGDS
jgi:uncharacterized membrane protein YqjE